ncbi:MAG: hypothetical protein QM668_21925 [Agriterribacter sp.]
MIISIKLSVCCTSRLILPEAPLGMIPCQMAFSIKGWMMGAGTVIDFRSIASSTFME